MKKGENILESNARLSRSILWELQSKAYRQFGIEAWDKHGVPAYLTSNSYIARGYAHVVLGYLRDCLNASLIDPKDPVYLLDLGAGTGRFAYFFLQELFRLLHSSSLPVLTICYVMTEIVPSNIGFWQQHPYLKPYFEQGILDCAYYHHGQTEAIQLINRKETLSKESLKNPLALICNYFFDTIPQDLFRFNQGQLEEGCITLFVRDESSLSLDPSIINHLQCSYSYHPLQDPQSYYANPEYNLILNSYSKLCEGRSFLFPIGALQVLSSFIEWSQSGFLLLAGDQGVCTSDQLKQSKDPKLALHGTFSFPVSYHSIAAFFKQQGGKSWLTSFSDPDFVIMAAVLGMKHWPETSLAFCEHLDHFEPIDYFKLVSLTQENWKAPPLDYILLLIKLGNWDANVLHTFFSAIQQALPLATEKQKQIVYETINCIWEHFYPIGPSTGDFVLNLGVLLFQMSYFKEAKIYFDRSILISGINEKALKNIAACYHMLGENKEAKEYQHRALLLKTTPIK